MTVKAWARPDYAAQRAAHPSQRRHYVVAKGEYFPGFCRDPSIEKASFMGIVEKLAADLSKQGYFPAQAMDQADELVVVHWGTTIPFVSEYANEAVDNPNYYTPHAEDFGGIDSGLQDSLREIYNNRSLARAADAQALDQAAHALTSRSLAGLLGYASDLAELGKTPARDVEERMLLANLSEERYFIIVMSFDLHDLLEDHHRAILWTEHMSMRAPGTNFSTALVSMSRMAGPLAGRSIDHIMTDRSPAGGPVGQVEIGPIRVLGMGAAAAPAK